MSCYKESSIELGGELRDPALAEALADFRSSVHAWSEVAYGRPRTPRAARRSAPWRLASGWALGCAVLAGGLCGGIYQHHRTDLRVAAQREAARQLAAERIRQEEEQLAKLDTELAKVDSDVSREVPSALDPLAQLMAEDEPR